MSTDRRRTPTLRKETRVALLVLAAVVVAVAIAMSIGMWLHRTDTARLVADGVDTPATPTGAVCRFEVKKYRGWVTRYAAIYAYSVDGERHETRGAADSGDLLDVPTDTSVVRVRYLPEDPTTAVAHDERIQDEPSDARSVPPVTDDCTQ